VKVADFNGVIRMYRRTVIQVLDFSPRARRSMELFLVSLAERLLGKGWRTVHVFAREPGPYIRDELRRLDLPYHVARFQLTLAEARSLGSELRQYQPDVLQTHFLSPFSPALLLLKRRARARRLLITDHTSGLPSRKSLVGRLLARLRGAFATRYIDGTIAVSDFVRDRDVQGLHLPARKVRTIHNGVDTAEYRPTSSPRNAVFTLGFVGQLIKEKGVLTLLRAMSELEAEGAGPLRALIAGRGPQERELKDCCAASGLKSVEFLGHIDRVPQLLNSVDVVVVPSEWEEAFGFAVVEGMACGACVLASDAGGIPEVVGPDGEAGLLFKKGDVGDLKRQLRALLGDPERRERLRVAARQRAVQYFSLQWMVDNYVKVFDELDGELSERACLAACG
jgi:glycosyltransferase involved in cell wall biosynthesis